MADEKEYEPTFEDFSGWDDEKEEKAIAAVKGANGIKHVIGDSTLFIRSDVSGNVYKLPLCPSYDQIKKLQEGEESEAIDNFYEIAESMRGGKESVEKLRSEPIQVLIAALSLYGSLIAKTQGVSLGE